MGNEKGELDKLDHERKAALSDFFEALQGFYAAEEARRKADEDVRATRRRLTRLAKGQRRK